MPLIVAHNPQLFPTVIPIFLILTETPEASLAKTSHSSIVKNRCTTEQGVGAMATEKRKPLTKDDELKLFFDYGVNPATRRIILASATASIDSGESGVDSDMWKKLATGLTVLERWPVLEGQDPSIVIEMSNPGGDVYHMFGIYDRIKRSGHHITIEAYGYLMSAGSIIFQAGDKRIMAPNTTMMLHYGEDGFSGHSKNLQRHAKESGRLNTKVEDIYLWKINEKMKLLDKKPWTREQLEARMKFDWFITPEEAVEIGLADEVAEYNHTPP